MPSVVVARPVAMDAIRGLHFPRDCEEQFFEGPSDRRPPVAIAATATRRVGGVQLRFAGAAAAVLFLATN